MKKKIKGNPRPKASGRKAPRTRKKPFRLEVGKVYMRRDGLKAKVTEATKNKAWPFAAVTDYWEDGRFSGFPLSYKSNGRFLSAYSESHGDLIREVPSAKRPVAPKARRAPK